MHTKNINQPEITNVMREARKPTLSDEESAHKAGPPQLQLGWQRKLPEPRMPSLEQPACLHSSKFPIEREALSLGEKNTKISVLHEYKQRNLGRAAIAPDAPIKQQAWVHEVTQVQETGQDTRRLAYHQSTDTYASPTLGSTKTVKLEDQDKTRSLSRTYHTIREMISSRFGPSRKESEDGLNNAAAESDGIAYAGMQPKSGYNSAQLGYQINPPQQSVPLPGQLSLPSGQGAQLHVTHHGGIASAHQTAYAQPTTVQSPARTGMAGHNASPKHPMQQQQQQQMMQQRQLAHNLHQRQLLQQQMQSVGLPSPVSNYQQYQQSRQAMSQLDLPSTAYFHYGRPNPNPSLQQAELQRRSSQSQPQLAYGEEEQRNRRPETGLLDGQEASAQKRIEEPLENGVAARLKIQQQAGSGSDYDKAGQSSSNVDSGRGSSSGRRVPQSPRVQGQDAEWVDIVESELRGILEPKDLAPTVAHSDSVSSVTPPLPPLTPSPRTSRSRFSASLPYGVKPNYGDCAKSCEKRNCPEKLSKQRSTSASKKFSQLLGGVEAGDVTSTTTGLDLDSMLDRSDSDLSTNDARTIRKQLEGLENMYSEVLKLLGGNKKRRKARGLASYGSVSSLPTSSVSTSRPRHHDKRRSYDDRLKKAKDAKSVNKRFQRLESHVVTLARSVAHLSSEMRTQHIMIQEMEHIRGEMAALRTQTSMAMVRSQSQPAMKDSELPALSNPCRVKKLTRFFGAEPPLIRLFLRELGYEKYAGAFEKERVGMVELPYLSEERLQKMGVPLGPRLRILQDARISVCKEPVYVV